MSGAAEISPPAPLHRAPPAVRGGPPAPPLGVVPAPRLFGPPAPAHRVQQRRVARTELTGERQPFFDRPKLLRPKMPAKLAAAVDQAIAPGQASQAPAILVRYERIPLEHMRPLRDKHGNLVRDAEGRPRLVPK